MEGLSAKEVADRLGVETATVYAYVSRGALERLPGTEGRRSRYDPDQVEELARRTRPRSTRRRTGAVDVVIGTTVSEIGDGWVRYRDRDLGELAATAGFEEVCGLLWTGELAAPPPPTATGADVERAVEALPAGATIDARLATAAVVVGCRTEPTPMELVHALVTALSPIGDDPGPAATVAERLWPRVSPLPANAARVRALEVALVLLAEHELATSTLAVRVAASTGAAPASCVLAGLGAVAGPLHGKAAIAVHRQLLEGAEPTERGPLQGFGHSVHRSGDPRYAPLLAVATGIAAPRVRQQTAQVGRRTRTDPPPNVDAALGALAFAAEMEVGVTEAVFSIARTAGWLAHAHEEADEPPLRFRGRTRYRGPRAEPA